MKHPKPKSKKTQAALLRIGGMDTQVVQFMDYPDVNDPQGRHILVVSFGQARLSDANDQEIFTGQIIVRINTTITPASLSIITRLLEPFNGYFVMIVTGSYITPGSYAEVYADDVPWTNIQPTTTKGKQRFQNQQPNKIHEYRNSAKETSRVVVPSRIRTQRAASHARRSCK